MFRHEGEAIAEAMKAMMAGATQAYQCSVKTLSGIVSPVTRRFNPDPRNLIPAMGVYSLLANVSQILSGIMQYNPPRMAAALISLAHSSVYITSGGKAAHQMLTVTSLEDVIIAGLRNRGQYVPADFTIKTPPLLQDDSHTPLALTPRESRRIVEQIEHHVQESWPDKAMQPLLRRDNAQPYADFIAQRFEKRRQAGLFANAGYPEHRLQACLIDLLAHHPYYDCVALPWLAEPAVVAPSAYKSVLSSQDNAVAYSQFLGLIANAMECLAGSWPDASGHTHPEEVKAGLLSTAMRLSIIAAAVSSQGQTIKEMHRFRIEDNLFRQPQADSADGIRQSLAHELAQVQKAWDELRQHTNKIYTLLGFTNLAANRLSDAMKSSLQDGDYFKLLTAGFICCDYLLRFSIDRNAQATKSMLIEGQQSTARH